MAALSSHISNSYPSSSSKLFCPKLSSPSIKIPTFNNSSPLSLFGHNRGLFLINSTPLSLTRPPTKLSFKLCSALQEITVEEEEEEEKIQENPNQKKKLYIFNLPWAFTVADIKNLFGQCGTVTDVEVIKQKNGRSRGFAFVTMASPDEAQAAVDKFDSQDVSGRIIKVEFAKRLKKPPPPRPPGPPPPRETHYKLYASNLSWKVRSNNLREFVSEHFNPVATRVVFDSPSGRSAGYGFVSFATKEEAEAALSSLDGKELMGRPLRLKFSEKNVDASGIIEDEEKTVGDHPEVAP